TMPPALAAPRARTPMTAASPRDPPALHRWWQGSRPPSLAGRPEPMEHRPMTRPCRVLLSALLASCTAVACAAPAAAAGAVPAPSPVTVPDSASMVMRARSGLDYQVSVAWPDYP